MEVLWVVVGIKGGVGGSADLHVESSPCSACIAVETDFMSNRSALDND
jgi:hypothetical protein